MKLHVAAVCATELLALATAGNAHAGLTFVNIIDPLNPTFTQAHLAGASDRSSR